MLLSIVIPAYNEQRTIAAVLERVATVDTESLGFSKEILVCDDGSSDGTARVVEMCQHGEPAIRLVRHAQNSGKGAAIRTALTDARGEWVLIQDADLEYDPEDYPALLAQAAAGAPVVFGTRFLGGGRPEGMRTRNYIANRILTATANLLYGLELTDEATCFKLFRTDILRSLELECTGFEFCPEVIAKLGRRGIPIVEVPIHYRARGVDEGKKIRWVHGVEALAELLRHRI